MILFAELFFGIAVVLGYLVVTVELIMNESRWLVTMGLGMVALLFSAVIYGMIAATR